MFDLVIYILSGLALFATIKAARSAALTAAADTLFEDEDSDARLN
ncbi:MAG: hypothetical protein AAF619_09650 [Pseudomonadota bacterium]